MNQGIAESEAWEAGDWPYPKATVAAALPLLYEELSAKGIVVREHLPLHPNP